MACNIDGSGCKVCPGMWIAGLLFLVMMIQSFFFRSPTPATIPVTESASQPMEATEISNTPRAQMLLAFGQTRIG